ncbi:hypothetical protein GCM10027408_20370 [Microbacterium tumbae]
MHVADQIVWDYADERGIVPMRGLGNLPGHIRDHLSDWIRRPAAPCPHSVSVATIGGCVFRVVGQPTALCPSCAVEAHIERIATACGMCGHRVEGDGQLTAFTVAGSTLILGAWCAACWEGEDE